MSDSLSQAGAQAWVQQEQLLHPLRSRHPGHYQPLEDSLAPVGIRRRRYGVVSFLVAFGYLIYKLINWDRFSVGTAPVVIGMFFLGSIQLFCIGMLGEYIGTIHTQVSKR